MVRLYSDSNLCQFQSRSNENTNLLFDSRVDIWRIERHTLLTCRTTEVRSLNIEIWKPMSKIERQLEEIGWFIRIDVVTMIHKADDDYVCPALYAAPARRGYFPQSVLIHIRSLESFLQGHPDMNKTPGVDSTSGSILANYWRKHK